MPKKILLIDDEPEILKLLAKRLEDAGFEVITAPDGIEGLDKARATNPDLILLDILMPRIDGFDVCRLLKFDERYKNIPILLLTAKTQDADKETGRKVGANGYITKPFESSDLIAKIRELLGE